MQKATFDNDKDLLWPGQFVEVSLLITTRENAVTLPTSAIQNGQNGPYVYVVRPNKTVEYRPVKMGPAFEDYSVVDNGLNVGETVVIDGQLRLAPNMPIVVRNEGASRS
jgi:multidrug efflux system membrane fusion protein